MRLQHRKCWIATLRTIHASRTIARATAYLACKSWARTINRPTVHNSAGCGASDQRWLGCFGVASNPGINVSPFIVRAHSIQSRRTGRESSAAGSVAVTPRCHRNCSVGRGQIAHSTRSPPASGQLDADRTLTGACMPVFLFRGAEEGTKRSALKKQAPSAAH